MNAGLYYWAGPGTIRMIELKYFHPKIYRASFQNAYEYPLLKQAKEKLGVTDAWVTYSWGFGDETEKPDHEFLKSKLPNFQKLGIRTHAYVQGMNLVYNDFREKDFFCKNHIGKFLPYHRGRKLCCPINPNFREFLKNRVTQACQLDVNGIFIDNVHFGQIPIVHGDFATFIGCACRYCQEAFRKETGSDIPKTHNLKSEITEKYLAFRIHHLMTLMRELSEIAGSHGKLFGSNSYDTGFQPEIFFGTSIEYLEKIQDYLLFENHNHPLGKKSNSSLMPMIRKTKIPTVVVSYRKPIGKQPALKQKDIDAVFTESQKLGYVPCYKASEFTTRGMWHSMNPRNLNKPQLIELPSGRKRALRKRLQLPMIILKYVNKSYRPLMEKIYENRLVRGLFGWIIDKAMTMRHPSV